MASAPATGRRPRGSTGRAGAHGSNRFSNLVIDTNTASTPRDWPVALLPMPVHSRERTEDSISKVNDAEAEVVVRVVEGFLRAGRIRATDIAVITPVIYKMCSYVFLFRFQNNSHICGIAFGFASGYSTERRSGLCGGCCVVVGTSC